MSISLRWSFFPLFFISVLLLTLLPPLPLSADIDYTVTINVVGDDKIKKVLQDISVLASLSDRPPATVSALRRRSQRDVDTMIEALHSYGYYDGAIESKIDIVDSKHQVNLIVTLGPQYRFSDIQIRYSSDQERDNETQEALAAIQLSSKGLTKGDPALATVIITARDHLLYSIGKRGFPLPQLTDESILVDTSSKTVSVVYHVDPGKKARLGAVTISGLRDVRKKVIDRKITWEEGDQYHPKTLEALEKELQTSALFDYARVHTADAVEEDGTIPIIIELIEAKHRSIGAGVSYNTQQGPGVSGEWEHRNIRRRGEQFGFRTYLWNRLQRGTAIYRIPNFICNNQELIWLAEFEQEETKSYEERSATISAGIETKLSKRATFGYGLALKQLESSKSDNSGSFTLVKLPLMYMWSNASDLLDPTSGRTFIARVTPTHDLHTGFYYTTGIVTAIVHLPIDSSKKNIVSTKLIAGAIMGESRLTIPAPERFYSGSEHTLRGYNYLSVSPLDDFGDPIGGRSILVASVELRTRFREKWGWVTFYEVGNVYGPSTPQITHRQLQSLGVGIRYFTPIGPLRLDVATPINRRNGLDNPIEIYFSIGQAF